MSKTLLNTIAIIAGVVVLAGCTHKTPVDTPATTGDVAVDTTTGSTIDNTTQEIFTGTASRTLNVSDSVLEWKGSRVKYGYTGTVAFTKGSLEIIDGIPSSGELTIDMTSISITNGSEMVRKHLSSDDFFAIESYPEARLAITSSELLSGTNFNITADLTIKDSTNPITFIAVFNEDFTQATTSLSIDRTLWDIRFGSNNFFDNLGDKAINNTIEFKVSVLFE